MKKTKIGFIGLGNMGIPMSKNMIDAGYDVYGYDINPVAVETFSKNGGRSCSRIQDVLAEVEAVFISLPSPPVVEKVYFGEEGIIKHARKGTFIMDTSTVSPELNKRLDEACAEKGIKYLGAPVSGGVIGAIKATLTFMVGGNKAYFDEVLPLLNVVGKNHFHVGESADSGTIIKLINNLMIGFYTQAVGEAITLGEKKGLDPEQMYEILSVSYGQSRIYERNYKEYIAAEDYNPGFTTNLLLKDLRLAKAMAEECGAQLPIGSRLVDWYDEVVESGYGENDMSAVYLMLKEKLEEKN